MPALISLFLRSRLSESEVWEKVQLTKTTPSQVLRQPHILRRMVYLVLLMTAFNWMSHGTQDIYPTFLKKGLDFSPNTALYIAILYNVGAMFGGTILGTLSERLGPALDHHPGRRAGAAGGAAVRAVARARAWSASARS